MDSGNSLSWLHLSDLHACNPRTGWDARRVLSTLLADLKAGFAEVGGAKTRIPFQPDLLFFTGDLVS
jgi:hypothetical protein